jgi:hypothetical protein
MPDLVTDMTAGIALVALAASVIAIWQTGKYQDRAWIHARWDRIGLVGGITEETLQMGDAPTSVPYMAVTLTNYGRAHARMLDLTVSTFVVGLTQETDDGVRPYQERDGLGPGDSWEIRVPLVRLRQSFDHPIRVEGTEMERPTIQVRWFDSYSKRMKRKRVRLDGRWLQLYAPFHETALTNLRSEAVPLRLDDE